MSLFTEVFPINTQTLRSLHAYTITTATATQAVVVGHKVAYRLSKSKEVGGTWVWHEMTLITNEPVSASQLRPFLKTLWQNADDSLHVVQGITPISDWQATAADIAEFVANGLAGRHHWEVMKALGTHNFENSQVKVEREYTTRGRVVDGQPAVSISVSSTIIYRRTLKEYMQTIEEDVEDTIHGLLVASAVGRPLKGKIVGVAGPLKEKREWLRSVTTQAEIRQAIETAADSELLINVRTASGNVYQYLASILQPVMRMEDMEAFEIDGSEIMGTLRLDPDFRTNLVRTVFQVYQRHNLLQNAFRARDHAPLFLSPEQYGFSSALLVGNNQRHTGRNLMATISKHGVYKRAAKFYDAKTPIKIGFIKGFDVDLNPFLLNLQKRFKQLRFSLQSVGKPIRPKRLTQAQLEIAVNELEGFNPDIILAFLPGQARDIDQENDNSPYHIIKGLTIGRDLPSQVIYGQTLGNQYALDNISLGILSKVGNIPFLLAESLSYADMVVGLDVSRMVKQNLPGSVNATAIARIYFNDGRFLRYALHDAAIEGETIPPGVLRRLFPVNEFQGKRVVVHRDGLFRGEEKEALAKWAEDIEATFYFVEVIKSGAPRLYRFQDGEGVIRPEKGDAFRLSDSEAFLVSSLPPFKDGNTPRPLHIRADGLPIEQALHSVLSLTLLHYGSIREPRLPVTIHYSDKISGLALRGVKPKSLEGDKPFWL